MPEGPFGIHRPFVDTTFVILIGFMGEEDLSDKIFAELQQEELDEPFNVILENIEVTTFNRIANISENIDSDVLGVRIVDQLEIRLNVDDIEMGLLNEIVGAGAEVIAEATGESPEVIITVE